MKSIWEYDKQKANIEQFLIKTIRDKQSVKQPQKGKVYRFSHLV